MHSNGLFLLVVPFLLVVFVIWLNRLEKKTLREMRIRDRFHQLSVNTPDPLRNIGRIHRILIVLETKKLTAEKKYSFENELQRRTKKFTDKYNIQPKDSHHAFELYEKIRLKEI